MAQVKDSKSEAQVLKEAVNKIQKMYGLRVASTHRIQAFFYKVKISQFEFYLTCGISKNGTWYKLRSTEDLKRTRSVSKLLNHFGKSVKDATIKAYDFFNTLQVEVEGVFTKTFSQTEVHGYTAYEADGMNILDVLKIA